MQYALTLIALAILVLGAYYLIPNYFRLYLHRSVGEAFIMRKVIPFYFRRRESPRGFNA